MSCTFFQPALSRVRIQCTEKAGETLDSKLRAIEAYEHQQEQVEEAKDNVKKLEENLAKLEERFEENKKVRCPHPVIWFCSLLSKE